MATPIVMPRQGQSVETCVVQKWLKHKGDAVAEGEVLFGYETDKASFEFNAPASGTLLDVFYGDEADVPVLSTMGVIGTPGEDISSYINVSSESSQTAVPAASVDQKSSSPESSQPTSSQAAVESVQNSGAGFISPRARNRANQRGLDASQLTGSGPNGRIIERDVIGAHQSPLSRAALETLQSNKLGAPATGRGIGGRVLRADLTATAIETADKTMGSFTEVKLSNMRKIIATRMHESLQQTAQLTMHLRANAQAMLTYRAMVKKSGAAMGLGDITITDLVTFAVCKVLAKTPELNATMHGTSIRQYADVNIAIAMDTPRGLMVPVILAAQTLSLNTLSQSIKTTAGQARAGSIDPDRLTGGTFTITNLGMFGIESFTPVLNIPQVAILGVNTIVQQAVAGENGAVVMAPFMGLSLTIDHRALDGAPAARFLKLVATALENIEITLKE